MNSYKTLSISVLLSALSFGCSESSSSGSEGPPAAPESEQPTPPLPTGLTPIDKTYESEASEQSLSLCGLVAATAAGGGTFRVVSMGSRMEDTPRGVEPYTYVEFERLTHWYGARIARPVGRMYGGRTGNSLTDTLVALSVGQEVGLLLVPPREESHGFYGIGAQGTFSQETNGEWTNGVLFIGMRMTLDEIGSAAAAAFEQSDPSCPQFLDQGVADEVQYPLTDGFLTTIDETEVQVLPVVDAGASEGSR